MTQQSLARPPTLVCGSAIVGNFILKQVTSAGYEVQEMNRGVHTQWPHKRKLQRRWVLRLDEDVEHGGLSMEVLICTRALENVQD